MTELLLSWEGYGISCGLALLLGFGLGRKSKRTVDLRLVSRELAEIRTQISVLSEGDGEG